MTQTRAFPMSFAVLFVLLFTTRFSAAEPARSTEQDGSSPHSFSADFRLRETVGFSVTRGAVDQSTHEGSMALSATYYPENILDDGRPFQLQPFLQRAIKVGLVAFVSGAQSESSMDERTIFQGANRRFGAALYSDTYLRPFLALSGGVGVSAYRDSYSLPTLQHMPINRQLLSLPLTLGIGFRISDTRIDGRYHIEVVNDGSAWRFGNWGVASIGVESVIRRMVSLQLGMNFEKEIVAASVAVQVYPTRRLELGLGGNYRHQFFFVPSTPEANRVMFTARCGYWFRAPFGLAIDYTISENVAEGAHPTHQIGLELYSRI